MNKFLITMQYNENYLLPIFLRHYSQYFPPENIFIIDHGSSSNLVPEGFNRIYIPRDRLFSENSRLELIKSISNGLLNYYDLGVYADCDELISFKDVDFSSILHSETYVAGFEVFWNDNSELIGLINPYECKPLIFKRVPSWRPGFHSSKFEPRTLNIPMVHIRYLHVENAIDRQNSRVNVYECLEKVESASGINKHWEDGAKDLNEFYAHINSKMNNESTYLTFHPIEPSNVFDKHYPRYLFWGAETSYHAKGDWRTFNDMFYNLSSYFPSLINAQLEK